MKITIEHTEDLFEAELLLSGEPPICRRWVGATDDGVPVHAYVLVVSPQTHDPEVLARFEAGLVEHPNVIVSE